MKVKAVKVGFYGQLRQVGEVFDIQSKKELGSWMEDAEKETIGIANKTK